jgi:hypothetical protein
MKFNQDEEEIAGKDLPVEEDDVLEDEDDEDGELNTLHSSILMLDSESDSDYRSNIDLPWSEASSTLHSIDEKVILFRSLYFHLC